MPSLDDNCQNGNIRRIDTGNAACLCEVFWMILLELLPAFKADSRTCIVIKPGRYADHFILLCTCGANFFLADVTRIVLPYPKLFNDRFKYILREWKISRMVSGKLMNLIEGTTCIQMMNQRLPLNFDRAHRTILNFLERGEDVMRLLPNDLRLDADTIGG